MDAAWISSGTRVDNMVVSAVVSVCGRESTWAFRPVSTPGQNPPMLNSFTLALLAAARPGTWSSKAYASRGFIASRASVVAAATGRVGDKFAWVPLMSTAVLKPNSVSSAVAYGQEIAVAVDKQGALYAMANKAPPAGQPLTFSRPTEAKTIRDPVCGTEFDMETGKAWCEERPPLSSHPLSSSHQCAGRHDAPFSKNANRAIAHRIVSTACACAGNVIEGTWLSSFLPGSVLKIFLPNPENIAVYPIRVKGDNVEVVRAP